MVDDHCERCQILSGELMQRDEDIKILNNGQELCLGLGPREKILWDNLQEACELNSKVIMAHTLLLSNLAQILIKDVDKDDPEMAQSMVITSIGQFFKDVGYDSVNRMIAKIKMYY